MFERLSEYLKFCVLTVKRFAWFTNVPHIVALVFHAHDEKVCSKD